MQTVNVKSNYDLVIIGGGPAGMAAAMGARQNGVGDILVLEREDNMGGILQQCIHAGFGLHVFKEELTGPEYAHRYLQRVIENEIAMLTHACVIDIVTRQPAHHEIYVASPAIGLRVIQARAVILAMGCRERTRQAIHIPGSRPSGVYTAGCAQKLTNIMGVLPGKRIAILGSGDIGLIMARRLTLEGAEVVGVFELMPYSNGLTRNIVQCLDDYGIPLHLSTTISHIYGSQRLTAIDVAPVDAHFKPVTAEKRHIDCDTLLLSIGLIPETELAIKLGMVLHPKTRGPLVNSRLETSIPGIFACGNVLHVHDLVDFVTQESLRAGAEAAKWLQNPTTNQDDIVVLPGQNVGYCLPGTIKRGVSHTISLRVTRPLQGATLKLGDIFSKKMPIAIPSEMITFTISADKLESFTGNQLTLDVMTQG